MLKNSIESEHLGLGPNLRKSIQSSIISIRLAVGFCICSLSVEEIVPLFLRVFYYELI
jgi:hypothetical protein